MSDFEIDNYDNYDIYDNYDNYDNNQDDFFQLKNEIRKDTTIEKEINSKLIII